jgi:uncharacterized membrane protein
MEKLKQYGLAISGSIMGVLALVPSISYGAGIDDLVNTATTTFETTTGFSMTSALAWGVDNLLKVFMGTGLAVLYVLRYWIVALAVLGILIYFGFRGFRFWKH